MVFFLSVFNKFIKSLIYLIMRNKDLLEVKQFVTNLIKNENYDVQNVYNLTINYCNNLKIKLNSQEIKDIVDSIIFSHKATEKIDGYEDFNINEKPYLNSLETEDFESYIF